MMPAVLQSPERIAAERQENASALLERPEDPFPRTQPRRRLSLSALACQQLWQQLRCAPATTCYLAALWGAGLVTGSIVHGPSRWLSGHVGVGLPSLGHGYWWTPLTAGLWASGLGSYLAVTTLGLLILAPAERRMGAVRTVTTLLASQAAGLLLAVGLIRLAGLGREPWLSAQGGETVVGALPGMLGVGFALSCTLTPLWRRRLPVLVGVLVAVPALCGTAAALVANANGPRSLGVLVQAAPALLLLLTAYGLRRRFDRTEFRPRDCAYPDPAAPDLARAILRRGGSTLSYMSTWPGNTYWFSPDGGAAIAYRTIGTVALTVGGPFGDPASLDTAITGFAEFCEDRDLQPCLYSVTSQAQAVTRRLGWTSVQIAEDTLLPLACLEFKGKKWQDVRTALNRAAREGITAQWWSFPEVPPELAGQIRRISRKWMADKGLPEMGFTLGGLEELNDPDIRCLIAVGPDREVHGITSWMPVYADGRPIGWTLDFMRRNTEPGAFSGVMEFLIASAALTFREEGASFASLSAVPLARLDRGEQPSAPQDLLNVIAGTIEPVYGFQSLLRFKAKFQPVYQPLYLTYPDPAALASIATAIGRAYLPRLTARQALCLLTKLRWPRRRNANRHGVSA
jgi:lysylphosphatidylglycerol synthetase-like protein (DUF2156 family)